MGIRRFWLSGELEWVLRMSNEKNHYGDFEDAETLLEIRRYITSIGANNPHSGKRFHEALYNALKQFDPVSKEKE